MKFEKKKIVIAVGLALVIGSGVYIYNSYSKEQLKEDAVDIASDVAIDLGAKALEYGKGKVQEHLNKKIELSQAVTPEVEVVAEEKQSSGAVLSEGVEEITKIIDDKGMEVKRTEFIEVEHPEFINLYDLSIKPADADKMLSKAIRTNDVKEVKYLIDGGVSVEFTEDKVCYVPVLFNNIDWSKRTHYSKYTYEQKVIPREVRDLKKRFFEFRMDETYTTDCGKLFLHQLAPNLQAELADFGKIVDPLEIHKAWERIAHDILAKHNLKFDNYLIQEIKSGKGKWAKEKEEFTQKYISDHTERYRKAKEIYDIIIPLIPKKDYYQFAPIIADSKVALPIRMELLEKYIDYLEDPVLHPNRQFFIDLYKQAGTELYEEMSDKQKVLRYTKKLNPKFNYMASVETLMHYLDKGFYQLQSDKVSFDTTKTLYGKEYKEELELVKIPEPTVQSLTDGLVDYKVENLPVELRQKLSMFIKATNVNFYYVNNELSLINKILNYDKTLLTGVMDCSSLRCDKDLFGGNYLHYIVYYADGRPSAILLRFLLNNGYENPNHLNSQGDTAHSLLIKRIDRHQRVYNNVDNNFDKFKEIEQAFMNKEYN